MCPSLKVGKQFLINLLFCRRELGFLISLRKKISHRKKKVLEFPVPSRDVTTKLSLAGNNDVITELFLPRGNLVSDIPAGDGKLVNLFLRCIFYRRGACLLTGLSQRGCDEDRGLEGNYALHVEFFLPIL